MTKPTARQPLTLITNVAQGKTDSVRRSIAESSPYRLNAPIAPPRPTASATTMRVLLASYERSAVVGGRGRAPSPDQRVPTSGAHAGGAAGGLTSLPFVRATVVAGAEVAERHPDRPVLHLP